MRAYTRILTTIAAVVAGTGLVIGQTQGYRMTVSQDRLINAQNEQQNWLLMNGDYGNTRYSKLAQINRDNVKNLRMVWAMALGGMVRFYQREDRTLERQDLPLTDEQARAVEAELLDDLKPENRYYVYDHFADNCTTKLRDIIDHATGGGLRVDSQRPFPLTFRQMGRQGLAELPALIAFGDFAVGRALDRHPSLWEAMFHPYVLRDQVQARFGAEPRTIYTRRGPPIPDDGPTGRVYGLLIGLFFAVPLFVARWTGRGERPAVAIAAVPVALVGLVIWSAAIVSQIPGLRWNEAVFLYTPFDIVLPFLAVPARRRYAKVRFGMVLVVSLLRGFGIFRQPLWVPITIVFVIFGLCAIDTLPWRARPQPATA